jgi:polysaccharide biosynthesis/export protein
MGKFLVVLFLGSLFCLSCISKKNTVFFQDKTSSDTDTLTLNYPPYLIQPGDVLYVNVTSYKGELSKFFNQKSEAEIGSGSSYLEGYSVSPQGKIKLPVIDSIAVAGKSLSQIQVELAQIIHQYIQDADIIVKLANFHFTILGEVYGPGVKLVNSDQLTILEAIGMGGDMTLYAQRRRVRIYRKELNKTRIVTIDLTDRRLIESPYYYIQSNDVIYVEPASSRYFAENVKQFAFLAGVASVVYIIYRIAIL